LLATWLHWCFEIDVYFLQKVCAVDNCINFLCHFAQFDHFLKQFPLFFAIFLTRKGDICLFQDNYQIPIDNIETQVSVIDDLFDNTHKHHETIDPSVTFSELHGMNFFIFFLLKSQRKFLEILIQQRPDMNIELFEFILGEVLFCELFEKYPCLFPEIDACDLFPSKALDFLLFERDKRVLNEVHGAIEVNKHGDLFPSD
jgi:hypothetical protein